MKYQRLFETLKSEIVSGIYSDEEKLPYIKDLMTKYKVSQVTVQSAVKLLEREGYITGIPSKGLYINRRSTLKPSRSTRLKVAVVTYEHLAWAMAAPYFVDIYWGIEEEVTGLKGTVYPVGAHAHDISGTLNYINRLEINAVITVDLEPHQLIKELDKTGLPIVHTDTINFMSTKPILIADHVQAGKLAVTRLAELGHKKILFVDSFFEKAGRTTVTADKRWRGIREASAKHGVISVKRKAVTVRDEQRYSEVKKVLEDNADCTGIITQGHVMAHLIRSVVEKKKARFWEDKDLVVFGIQHHPYFIRDRAVWFCKWDGREMGRKAVKYLVDKSLRPRIRHFQVFVENNLDVASCPDDIYKV